MAVNNRPKLVRDLMRVGVHTCPPETTLKQLAQAFLDLGVDEMVVLDEGNAIGVVGQTDLVRAFALQAQDGLTAGDIMQEELNQILPEIPLPAAAQIMLDKGVRVLYLTHHAGGIEYPAAAISYRHILCLMAAEDDTDLQDLGIQARRRNPLERFIEKRKQARQRRTAG